VLCGLNWYLEFSADGHHQRGLGFAFEGLHGIEIFEETGSIVPRTNVFAHAILDIVSLVRRNRNEKEIGLGIKPIPLQEHGKSLGTFLVSKVSFQT